MTRIKAT